MIEIRKVKEHYEVYQDGEFLFSADTKREVEEELSKEVNKSDSI